MTVHRGQWSSGRLNQFHVFMFGMDLMIVGPLLIGHHIIINSLHAGKLVVC